MKLTIEYDRLILETRLNTYTIDRAPLEANNAWYDFTEFAVLNLWDEFGDGEYKAAVYPVTDAGDVMHEYGTKVEIVMVEEPLRRVVVEHDIFSLEDGSALPPQIVPAEEFGADFDKYEGMTLIHEHGEAGHDVSVRYKQTFMYTKKSDEQLLRIFSHKH